jgi:hypothetical protein
MKRLMGIRHVPFSEQPSHTSDVGIKFSVQANMQQLGLSAIVSRSNDAEFFIVGCP